jgi:transcriptional regulator GlxA family with amidase domain
MRYWVIVCFPYVDNRGLYSRNLAWQGLAEMPIEPQFPPKPRRVEFLAFPDVQLLDVTGPFQVLASANTLARDAGQTMPYELKVVSAVPDPIVSSAGLTLLADPLPAPGQPIDTLIVAGGAGVGMASRDSALLDWVGHRASTARRVSSVCSGAFILAAAGLLDGRRATTHWSRCAELAAAFPAVRVEHDPIYINDGNVWTSAGVTAGIDMALALLEADLGRPIATAVARHLVVFAKRPGGQAQFSAGLALAGSDATFDRLHEWMRRNLRGNLAVPALAGQAGMSERSFLRHYRQVIGVTPARAVERVRVEAARQALGETNLPVKRIARDCGFGSEETMRRSFMRVLSVPPHAYRERFPV